MRPGRVHLRAVGSRARHPLWWLPDPAAQQEEGYRRVWQNLRALSEVRDGRHDTDEWRARPGPFLMVCVPVPAEVLLPQVQDIREALRHFPFARIHPDGFLHIPIQEVGFLTDEPVRKDDVSPARREEFIEMAGRALRDFPRFPVLLGPVNSFADAAFLDVHDDGWLSRIQDRLVELLAVSPSTRYPYLPHVTIAHYDRSAPLGNLPGVLAEWRDTPLGSFVVTDISVVSLDTQETFPPFDLVHRFPLGTTRATGSSPVRPDPSQA